jgi:RNA polymerase sigma-70 factor (ECF subfamily)
MEPVVAAQLDDIEPVGDAQLMARIQMGDHDALAGLYDRYCERAYRIALVACGSPDLAEDAVQNAFLSIWNGRGGYLEGRGTVAAWLLTCVRHRAIDVWRRSSRHAGRLAPADGLDSLEASEDTAGQVERQVQAERVRELLELLPDAQREVITLAFYGGLSHTEIAAQLGVPCGTVKGRMRLGLRRLREGLECEAV